MINKTSKIFIAGHKGLVGSAILRKLRYFGYKKILLVDKKKLNLIDQKEVIKFLKKEKPKFIFIAAAKVGGIYANDAYKAQFIYENLQIQSNLIHGAYLAGVKDLIFLGSSCVYPKKCKQPIKEKYLLNGYLEKTNDAYAIAKIAGIKMCESYNEQYGTNYKCLMPTNTFGPNDNYDTENSHFIPALIKKVYLISGKMNKKVKLWGNGLAKRELIYVDDIADACYYFMNKKIKETVINIGTGKDTTIKNYLKIILKIAKIEKQTSIIYDHSKPNGTTRKVLDVSLAKKYGWIAKTNTVDALKKTYHEFKQNNRY
ncbi:MAG: GDP-fucose synthetase [Candidatus Endolissoclinum sp. TMED37]|nr:MAG: GDP-fucose synthetase [Candidatus Endolissoclinum sp. TMED37]|tara:strand:+ start:1932 stop:2873 length:942 start_codon:yes stop_codon:yes gene_type:complete